MIVRFAGGPLAGRELETTDAPWVGGWLTVGDADWGLYIPVHRDPATGVVLAEARVTTPRWWRRPTWDS
ncbi:hypothetical protein ABZ588_32920 [Streptomyces althioticus]|uniref:Uncharacterized protein n=1 Tax=Actinospica acidiphila TaxID=304899 RepID=A0A9X5CMQ0_9ACTN|nr:hypothetical protein [Actinospica acidiphila]NEC51339.1 hypothetical protein [Actinospica acidiphila]